MLHTFVGAGASSWPAFFHVLNAAGRASTHVHAPAAVNARRDRSPTVATNAPATAKRSSVIKNELGNANCCRPMSGG